MSTSTLQVDDVRVRFGGVVALDGVTLTADAGQVTGLIGPNGAGKTTLFNVVTGLQPPTSGQVRIDGDDLTDAKAHRRARRGVARTFQRLEVFTSLTVRDNIRVGAESGKARSEGLDTEQLTDELIERVGLAGLGDTSASELPTGTLRLVELGRALATRPRLLLLDEPASGLTEHETDDFGDLLAELAADGLAILLVEHDVEFVMRLCALVHVFDFGRLIGVGTPAEVQGSNAVREAYLGAAPSAGAA